MRIVLDTNVLVSALVFPGGSPEGVFRSVLEGRVELVTSVPLLTELGRVLVEKFAWEPTRAEEAVAQVAQLAHIVEPSRSLRVIEVDPDDDRVLEAAAEGRADVIVSGDGHLLGLGSFDAIRILGPSAFLAELA